MMQQSLLPGSNVQGFNIPASLVVVLRVFLHNQWRLLFLVKLAFVTDEDHSHEDTEQSYESTGEHLQPA